MPSLFSRALDEGLPQDILEDQLAGTETEISFWRLVATLASPERVAEVDAAIDACPRAVEVRAVVALSRAELIARMISNVSY